MDILIKKEERELRIDLPDGEYLTARIALGRQPTGKKEHHGDRRTPEGDYFICRMQPNGPYGRTLELSYPNSLDAKLALSRCEIDESAFHRIVACEKDRLPPPADTSLGGNIAIHEGGNTDDWTKGSIALDEKDMDWLYPLVSVGDNVTILP